jgi:hypothetical protein
MIVRARWSYSREVSRAGNARQMIGAGDYLTLPRTIQRDAESRERHGGSSNG